MRHARPLLITGLVLIVLALGVVQSQAHPAPASPDYRGLQPQETPTPPADDLLDATEEAEATEEVLGDYIPPGEWLHQPFTDSSGVRHTLDEFTGRGMIIQTLSISCAECMEQQRYLAAAIQDRLNITQLPDTVFLALSIEPQEPAGLLREVIKNELRVPPENWLYPPYTGDEEFEHPLTGFIGWETIQSLDAEGTSAAWLVGVASEDLIAALEDAFGPEAGDPNMLTVIAMDSEGRAFPLEPGLNSINALRNAILQYGNTP